MIDWVIFASMTSLIQLCGRFVVELEGKRLEAALPGHQGRLLFGYLALNRERAIPRTELVAAVWPDELPRNPADVFAALLSKVRAAVGGSCLQGRSELRLALPPDTEIDVHRALSAVHAAESACSRRDWARAWSASLTSRFVAERRLLGDYEAPWIDEWRRTLEDVLGRSLHCYATASLGLGGAELAAAERAARELVRLAPLRERGHALLMEVLEARGEVVEALLVYEMLRRRLRDEVGVAPSEALQAIHRRLLGTSAASLH